MHEIAIFVEDFGHQKIIGSLVERLAQESNVEIQLNWRSARHGHGMVKQELKKYLQDLQRQGDRLPELIIVATDANCKGRNERIRELEESDAPAPMIFAVPDPHVERWLLLDGAAFKKVFERGCDAPDLKCDRNRYKQKLINEISNAGITPSLGGIEFAKDIVREIDIERAKRADLSIKHFINEIKSKFQEWRL